VLTGRTAPQVQPVIGEQRLLLLRWCRLHSGLGGLDEVGWVRDWRGGGCSVSSTSPSTVHAVLPHTAHRRPLPAVFGRSPPGPIRPGGNDGSIEGDQPQAIRRAIDLGGAPCPAPLMPLGDKQRDPQHGVLPDLVELPGRVGPVITGTEEARGSNPLTSTTSTNVDPPRLLGLPGTPQIGRERLTASPLQPRMRGSPRRTTGRAHYRGLAWVLGMCVLAMCVWWRRAGRVVDQQGGPPPGHEVPGLLAGGVQRDPDQAVIG
jgi:hypothetical protein